MSQLLRIATFTCSVLCATLAVADGMVYRLPDDGGQAQYDLVIKAGPPGGQREMKGAFKLSSVGKETVGADVCRWIEIRLAFNEDGQERVILAKSLVPEKHLGRGKSPGDNMLRTWIKFSDQEAVSLTDLKQPMAGPLQAFLAGPASNAMILEKSTIENAKLGKQECEGEIASYEFDQGEGKMKMMFEHRLSDKVPFGVLSSKLTFRNERNGAVVEEGEATFTLSDVNTTALTELPNNR